MAREIECCRCHTYLGEIRDAKLKKGIVYMCDGCITAYRALELAHQTGAERSPYGDLFNGAFGDIFGNKFKK